MRGIYTLFLLSLLGKWGLCQEGTFNPTEYYWLEDVHSEEVIAWVDSQNEISLKYLESIELLPYLESWHTTFKEGNKWNVLSEVPYAAYQVGGYAERIRGQTWVRTPFDKYLKGKKPKFKVYASELNVHHEGEVSFNKIISREPDFEDCLVLYNKKGHRLMKGLVEFNTRSKSVVEGGFLLPPVRPTVYWRDQNSVYITVNLQIPHEHGNKLRIWERGEPIAQARVLFEPNRDKVRVKLFERGSELFVMEEKQAFDVDYFHLDNDKLSPIELPNDLKEVVVVSGQFVVQLRSGWQPATEFFPSGSLISIDFDSFLKGGRDFQLVVAADSQFVVNNIWNTDNILIARVLENVRSVLYEFTYSDGSWQSRRFESPIGGNITVTQTQNKANQYFITHNDFFHYTAYIRQPNTQLVKYAEYLQLNHSDDYEVNQWFATSKDGTRVPYFIVHKKGMVMDGTNPVIMTGYGGWGHAQLPYLLNQYCKWLEDDGVYVLTNVRGGGEYGPKWHYDARKSKRQNAYDDFQAIARDLVDRKVTETGRIGTYGASNGGLLVANGFIQSPGLFGAVVIRSGSIDLKPGGEKRRKGIGATGERGDQDNPEDWAYMKHFSSLHNLQPNKDYPPVLLFDSRNDDNSTPAHSRKFLHRMKDLGYDNVYMIETEGGSHGHTDLPNDLELELAFFYRHLHPDYEEILSRENSSDYTE